MYPTLCTYLHFINCRWRWHSENVIMLHHEQEFQVHLIDFVYHEALFNNGFCRLSLFTSINILEIYELM